ncbi:ATPase AAA [Trypanosoma conorhini]|uniref:ATPase AAA n=1 Tax=Trypanosoma conorhini TaxID=83891 RepID=A0A3R7MKZ1_9TRYP|nr:ATPase AAA [Trypanosoma conorhini]RNF07760.1 ATPase AAA [Trypanosoma conorhini]
MEAGASPVASTPRLIAASLLLGVAVGATATFAYFARKNGPEDARRRGCALHAGSTSLFSLGDGGAAATFSGRRRSQQDDACGGQRRRTSRRSNSGVELPPGLVSLRSLAARRLGQDGSRASSINLILKSCLGAEGLCDDPLGGSGPAAAAAAAEEERGGEAAAGDDSRELPQRGSESAGKTERYAPSSSLGPMDDDASSVSTLDGLFDDGAVSQSDDEVRGRERGANSNPGNSSKNNNSSALAPPQKQSTLTSTQQAGRSMSVEDGSDRQAHSGVDSSDANVQLRSLSQSDAVFSKRHFYHSYSGAIITRLPSVASVRCRSILQHLQGTSSSHKEESAEEEGSRSHLTHSIPSTMSLLDDPIYRVVITGGPCSGKTSCLSYLRRVFEKLNFNVFCVPEVATLLHAGGVNLILNTQEERIRQQRVILQMMMMLEDAFYELASMRSRPSLILYDRGTMDGSAYCSEEEWNAILKITGYSNEELSDARYDAVVHLVTAAIGAEEFYTLANNAARFEGIAEARRQDGLTLNAWRGHYLVSVVHNEDTDFEKKMMRVAEFIGCVTGIPTVEGITAVSASSTTTSATATAASSRATTVPTAKPAAPPQPSLPSPLPPPPPPPPTSVGSSPERKGEEEKGCEEEGVAHMAFLATGTRAFASGASLAGVSAHSLRHANSTGSLHSPTEELLCSAGVAPERTPLSSSQGPTLAFDAHAERGSLQRHFFVNRVDFAQIPADAVTASVVTITLVPLRAEYRTEVVIRLARANDLHPLYLRRVEYNHPERNSPSLPDGNQELKSPCRSRHVARVQITKASFLNLARRRDPSQPVIQKTTKRFFFNMRHFTLVTFQHPKELRGVCRLVAPADTTEEDIGGLAEVEPFSLLMREGVM